MPSWDRRPKNAPVTSALASPPIGIEREPRTAIPSSTGHRRQVKQPLPELPGSVSAAQCSTSRSRIKRSGQGRQVQTLRSLGPRRRSTSPCGGALSSAGPDPEDAALRERGVRHPRSGSGRRATSARTPTAAWRARILLLCVVAGAGKVDAPGIRSPYLPASSLAWSASTTSGSSSVRPIRIARSLACDRRCVIVTDEALSRSPRSTFSNVSPTARASWSPATMSVSRNTLDLQDPRSISTGRSRCSTCSSCAMHLAAPSPRFAR